VAGKYFQNEGDVQEAHSAIMAAFSDLCDLVVQSESFDEVRQQQIKEALGSILMLNYLSSQLAIFRHSWETSTKWGLLKKARPL
jgi:hypothetical protein